MSLKGWLAPGLAVILPLALLICAFSLVLDRGAVASAGAEARGDAAVVNAFLPLVLSHGPPPAVRTLPNDFLFADWAGNLRILGEVQNDLGDPLAAATVPVALLDGGGALLKQGSGVTLLDSVPPGGTACFDATIADPPPGWASYRLKPPTYAPGLGPLPVLRVISDTGTLDPAYATYGLVGSVRNDHASQVQDVRVVGTLYNGAGDVVGCAGVAPASGSLDPGQESEFSIVFTDRAYFDVQSYRLQAEGRALPLKAESQTP
jgi:hypothetical protein